LKRRTLISTRRRVPADRLTGYAEAWAALARAAGAAGAHAWRFVAEQDPTLFLEFLEFADDADPRGTSEVAEAADALDRFASGSAEGWLEVRE
jgi:hypothetical protein